MTTARARIETFDHPVLGRGLRTTRAFPTGTAIIDLRHHTAPAQEQTRHSIQVGANAHVSGPLVQYLNHSCDPNTFIILTTWALVALRDLQAREELRFFYPATEWDMVRPFVCDCGSPTCVGIVAGAKHLAQEILRRYALSHHVAELAARRSSAAPECTP